jgi:cell division topological specificity factor
MGFLDTLLGRSTTRRAPSSANVAKQRLVDVLVQDHVKITPEVMDAIRNDILKILSKHLDVDADKLQINLTRTERGDNFTANVPVRRGAGSRR